MVGFEGVFGTVFIMLALIVMNMIPCTENIEDKFCINGHFEDTVFAMKQMKDNPLILVISLLFMVCMSLYILAGVYITKFASSTQRSTIDVSRTMLVWLVFLMTPEGFAFHEKFDYI